MRHKPGQSVYGGEAKRLTGELFVWLRKEGNNSVFVSRGFEVIKIAG